ncbi:MAG: BBP7 family outer membrane beta-barrel protein [Planctomycetes bacterium]|nr:BBP7 family outer membrane beta-barrel protein [Planctomycetota bacterium]
MKYLLAITLLGVFSVGNLARAGAVVLPPEEINTEETGNPGKNAGSEDAATKARPHARLVGFVAQEEPAPQAGSNPEIYPSLAPSVEGGEAVDRESFGLWGDAEYLLWWMKGASLPPLVTTSPAGTARAQAGVLTTAGTQVLFGGSPVNDGVRSGGRFTAGYWFDADHTLGVEGSFLILETEGTSFAAGSDGTAFVTGTGLSRGVSGAISPAASTGGLILARPFFNVLTGNPDAELVAYPGVLAGTVRATASSTGLLGAEALVDYNLCCSPCYRLDAVGGYRFLRLSDTLEVSENLTSTATGNPSVPAGTTLVLGDHFHTRNDFHGGEIGLKGEFRRGPWVVGLLSKVAIGANVEALDIGGSTTITTPGGTPTTNPGGLLALQSNIGHFTKTRTMVIPEFGAKVSYQVTPHLRVFAGYTFLYWGHVLRAGNQVDLSVNPNLLPPVATPVTGALRPSPNLSNTNVWVQGIDLGMEFLF